MKSKKLLLGSLSAMALVATPIATVVSCGGKDSAATAATESKVSIVKATTDDYVLTYKKKNYLVSKDDAAKAGSFKAGAETITWDKKLSDGTVKFKNGKDDATVTSTQATADHFGLKTETGTKYLDALGLKKELESMLTSEDSFKTEAGITLKFDDKKVIVKDSLDKVNKLLKPGSLELTKVTKDDSGMLTLEWKSAAAKPVVKGSTQADVDALKNAFGANAALTTPAGGPIALVGKTVVKAADKAMDKTTLLTAINAIIKGNGAGIAATGLTDALIKADMKVEVQVTTATTTTVATGAAEITITAGSFHATVAIVLTK